MWSLDYGATAAAPSDAPAVSGANNAAPNHFTIVPYFAQVS